MFSTDTCSRLEGKSCLACECDKTGSNYINCDATGQCVCKSSVFFGKKCDNKDCEWKEWGSWSKCNCGQRMQYHFRSRSIRSNLIGNGKPCNQSLRHEMQRCPYISCSCTNGTYGENCENRDCIWGSWGKWTECTPCPNDCSVSGPEKNKAKCPSGTEPQNKTRSRTVAEREVRNGKCEGETHVIVPCGTCEKQCKYYRNEFAGLSLVKCLYPRIYRKPKAAISLNLLKTYLSYTNIMRYLNIIG